MLCQDLDRQGMDSFRLAAAFGTLERIPPIGRQDF